MRTKLFFLSVALVLAITQTASSQIMADMPVAQSRLGQPGATFTNVNDFIPRIAGMPSAQSRPGLPGAMPTNVNDAIPRTAEMPAAQSRFGQPGALFTNVNDAIPRMAGMPVAQSQLGQPGALLTNVNDSTPRTAEMPPAQSQLGQPGALLTNVNDSIRRVAEMPVAQSRLGQPGAMFTNVNDSLQMTDFSDHLQLSSYLGGEGKASGKKSCGKGCGDCCRCCVSGGWCYHADIWAEYLYLRPRDAEVAVATVVNSPGGVTTPLQRGPISVLDMDFQPAIRFGFDLVLNECTKVGASYTRFEGTTNTTLPAIAPFQVRGIVHHPGFNNAQFPSQQLDSTYRIKYDILDADFRQLLAYNDCYQLGYVFGVRGVQHQSTMTSTFTAQVSDFVQTGIDFTGIGLKTGLEWERYIACQCNLYAKATGSLIPGQFDADFDQQDSIAGTVVDTQWESGRIVTIWDLELGTGWTSKCGHYHLSLGYVFSAWTGMVQTDEWVQSVHQNSFIDMASTTTYDGLVGRLEARF